MIRRRTNKKRHPMNSRERVLTTIAHKEPDSVPLFFNAIEAKFVHAISQGDMVKVWNQLGVDVFVITRRSWCEGKPTGLGYSPEPPPPEESLGGAIYAGWNGVDEFGRRWNNGRYVGGAGVTRDDLPPYSPELKLNERYSRPVMEDWQKNYSDHPFALFSHSGPLGLTIEAFGLMEFFSD